MRTGWADRILFAFPKPPLSRPVDQWLQRSPSSLSSLMPFPPQQAMLSWWQSKSLCCECLHAVMLREGYVCKRDQRRTPLQPPHFQHAALLALIFQLVPGRVWASIGWGALSTVAGALVTRFGVRYGIVVYGLLCIPAVAAAWVLKPGPKPSEEVQGAGYGEGAGKGLKAPKASKAPSVGQVCVCVRACARACTCVCARHQLAVANADLCQDAHTSTYAQPYPSQDMLNALLAKAAAADEDPKAATPLPASLSLDVAPQPVAQQQQAAARPPTPLSPHALHATLSHDAGLRTRLLASYARSPSPSPRGASIQPYAGPIDAAASPPQPQLNTAPRGAGSGDDASCCSTPRSTAALLPNEFQRSAAPSPSPRAMRALGRAVAPAEGAERQQQAAAATDPYAPNATTPQQRLSLPLEDLIDLDGNSDLLDPEAAGTPPQTPCAARTPNAAGGPVSCSPFSRGVQVGQLIAAAAALEEDNGAHVSLGAGAGAVCTGLRAAERTAPVIGDRGGGQVDGVVVLSLSRATSRHALLGPEGVRQDSAAPDRPGTAAAAAAVASAQYLPTSTRATRSSDPGSLPVVEGHEGCSTDSAGRKLPVGVQDQQLGVVSLLAQPRVMTFMLRSLLIGYGLGAQGSFAFLLVQQLGGNALLMGLMLVVSGGPWGAMVRAADVGNLTVSSGAIYVVSPPFKVLAQPRRPSWLGLVHPSRGQVTRLLRPGLGMRWPGRLNKRQLSCACCQTGVCMLEPYIRNCVWCYWLDLYQLTALWADLTHGVAHSRPCCPSLTVLNPDRGARLPVPVCTAGTRPCHDRDACFHGAAGGAARVLRTAAYGAQPLGCAAGGAAPWWVHGRLGGSWAGNLGFSIEMVHHKRTTSTVCVEGFAALTLSLSLLELFSVIWHRLFKVRYPFSFLQDAPLPQAGGQESSLANGWRRHTSTQPCRCWLSCQSRATAQASGLLP